MLAELIRMMRMYYIQNLLSELVATLPDLKKDAIAHDISKFNIILEITLLVVRGRIEGI